MGNEHSSPCVTLPSADDFAKFLQKKSTTSGVPGAPSPTFTTVPSTCHLCSFDSVSEDKLVKIIIAALSKQCYLDRCPNWLLKECANLLSPYLVTIFNISLASIEFPSVFKSSDITTLLLKKSGLDASVPSNYWPISNLTFSSKQLERMVFSRRTDHLTHNELLP